MKRLVLCAALVATAAVAGDLCKGFDGRPMQLTPRGISTNNLGIAGFDAGFVLPTSAAIDVQCVNPDGGSASTTVCINEVTCTTRLGLTLTGNQALPTSTASNRVTLADGGSSALISVFCPEINVCNVCTYTAPR